MRTVTLLRHAKSSWDSTALDDYDRPLAPRGEQAAPFMGGVLREVYDNEDITPDLVLCSPAVRARQTLEAVLPSLPGKPEVRFEKKIYLASQPDLIKIVQNAPDSARHLILVGHNPGFHDIAVALAGNGPHARRERLARKFPTAAFALIGFDNAHWADTAPGQGQLITFATPKDAHA